MKRPKKNLRNLKKDQPALKGYRLEGTLCNLDVLVLEKWGNVGEGWGSKNG